MIYATLPPAVLKPESRLKPSELDLGLSEVRRLCLQQGIEFSISDTKEHLVARLQRSATQAPGWPPAGRLCARGAHEELRQLLEHGGANTNE